MSHVENLRWQRPLAFGLMAVLVIETLYLAATQFRLPAPIEVGSDFGSPEAVGQMLFSAYLLPFEATSILLLIAMVGVVVLTLRQEKIR